MALAVLIALVYGAVTVGVLTKKSDDNKGASFVPEFALDLAGGTEMVLTPVMENNANVTTDQIDQAINIIRSRIDASGVAEAEISQQGTQNIVVGIPGNPSAEDLALVTRSAHMTFRTVLQTEQGGETYATEWMNRQFDNPNYSPPPEDPAASPDPGTEEESPPAEDPEASPGTEEATASPDATASPSPSPGGDTGGIPVPPDQAFAERLKAGLDQDAIVTEDRTQELTELNCQVAGSQASGAVSDPDEPLVTCSQDGTQKYILGPVMVEGSNLDEASSGQATTAQGGTTGRWVVNIAFNSDGGKQFGAVTTELYARCQGDATTPTRQFAIVLDDLVISAPEVCQTAITDGRAEISGNFTQASSKSLADQLAFGSLPINFQVESQQQVSATLGSSQLEKGLWAGLVGLILVAIYSFFQYRALAFVTVSSLVIATSMTYGTILLLSWLQGYRLSLAGVAGVIVSIGITADSFIVYFERIKDELRVGRDLPTAVEFGWSRARRTIVAGDSVSFMAAMVLYFVAVGGVRGFAFTLGLTTIIDLVVVFVFTHPILLLLTRTRFWGHGHPWSGLDPHRLGAPGSIHYAGRGQVKRIPDKPKEDRAKREKAKAKVSVGAVAPAAPGTSIAERKKADAEAKARAKAEVDSGVETEVETKDEPVKTDKADKKSEDKTKDKTSKDKTKDEPAKRDKADKKSEDKTKDKSGKDDSTEGDES